MKKTMILAAMVAGGIISAQADTLGQWSFADQGLGGSAADAMHGTAGANVTASDIVIGSGYVNATSVEDPTIDGTYYSYIDATGRISDQHVDYVSATGLDAVTHLRFDTPDEYWGIGDWIDGTTGGGRIQISTLDPYPNNAGPADTGALYLNSSSSAINGSGVAVGNNLFYTVGVTANGSALTLEEFSFFASRTTSSPNRSWADWTLEVDVDGGGFTSLGIVTTGTADNSWNLESLDFADFVLADGSTATFRIAGDSADGSNFGRGIVIDDITISGGTAIPPTTFNNAGDGTWANAANWDNGVPTATIVANIAGNQTANLSAGTGTAKDLNVATVAGESATVNNGSLNIVGATTIGSGVASSGTVSVVSFDTASLELASGESAYGKLASGSVTLDLPVLDIATGSNSVGVIEITTGTMTVAGDINLATGQDSTLTATVPNGAIVLNATNNVFVGTGIGSSVTLEAADFAVTGPIGDFEVGEGSGASIKGLFSANDTLGSITVNTALALTAGDHDITELAIARQAGATASLTTSGSATTSLSGALYLAEGEGSDGTITDSTLKSASSLSIATGANSTATATLSITNVAGNVDISGIDPGSVIGSTATVHFLGDIHAGGHLYLGLNGIDSVVSLTVDGNLSCGRFNTAMGSNSVGTVVFDSCDLVTTGWHQLSGKKDSQSIVTGSSGLMSAGTVKISYGENSQTTLVVTNGTLSANTRLEVAEGSNSTATVQFATIAGATTNTAVKLATGVDSSGDLIIGTGLFAAKSLLLGNANNGIATITVGGDMLVTETITAEAGSYIDVAEGDFTWTGRTDADFIALWNAGTLRSNGTTGPGNTFSDYFQVVGDTATAGSVGIISISGPVAGNMEISWNSIAGRSYTIEYKTDLVVDSGWTTQTNVTGVGGVQTVPVPVDNTVKFYQVTTP